MSTLQVQLQARLRGHTRESDWFPAVDGLLSLFNASALCAANRNNMIFEYRVVHASKKTIVRADDFQPS